MPTRLPTGGPLNGLNERAKVNSRARSVPVTDLVRRHSPHTPSQLRRLIEEHYRCRCDCGIRSQGPVERFALNLYEAQFTDATYLTQHAAAPYQRCFEFIHALFCVAPLRGVNMENASRAALVAALNRQTVVDGPWETREASQVEDAECAVDFVLLCGGRSVVGVQVKPDSVLAREDVMALNRRKQSGFEHPVFFHIYSTETMSFSDESTHELVAAVCAVVTPSPKGSDALATHMRKRSRDEAATPAFW